jgi:hypothetical protein
LISRREAPGDTDFKQNWDKYKAGFGDLNKEFWIGNDKLSSILTGIVSSPETFTVRIDLSTCDSKQFWEQYNGFFVGDETTLYRLTIDGNSASGTAGNALAYPNQYFNQNKMAFSTYDRDHDQFSGGNCAATFSSGWWFNQCGASNLNGRFYACNTWYGQNDGIMWMTPELDEAGVNNPPPVSVTIKFRTQSFHTTKMQLEQDALFFQQQQQ